MEIQLYNQKTALTAPKPLPALKELQTVCANTGSSPTSVGLIAKGVFQDNIRALAKQDPSRAALELTVIVEFCAKTYCGGVKTERIVYEEAVRFAMARFGHLNPEEIKQAFSLGASGSLDVNMATYYGIFTVSMLGEILLAYDNYRSRIVMEILRVEREQQEANKKSTWDENEWGRQRLRKFQNLESPTYSDFSETDYNYFLKTGDLVHTQEEKRKAWDDARLFAIQEFEADAHTELTTRKNQQLSILLKNAAQAGSDGAENEKFTIRRTAIAKSLLVMRWAEKRK